MSELAQGSSLSAALALVALALVPLALVTLTSFAKIAVVLATLKNALGAPDVPSGSVVTALALALSVYVMAPLASELETQLVTLKGEPSMAAALSLAKEPIRGFLARNAGKDERAMFIELSRARGQDVTGDELSLLWASFALHELKLAFYLGFFVYLPFLVLDLVVASAILSLGLTGLPSQAVALPFKLLLFASVDGFALIARALVLSYK